MKKKDFVTLLLGTVGGILVAIGMCMCLLPQWNAFTAGVVVGCVGLAVLLVMLAVRRKMAGKPSIRLNGRALAALCLGIVGALALGVGMSMTMVWAMVVPGILVGCVGIVLLVCLVPVYRGIEA